MEQIEITVDDLVVELLSYSEMILSGDYDADMADIYLNEIAFVIDLLDKRMVNGEVVNRWSK